MNHQWIPLNLDNTNQNVYSRAGPGEIFTSTNIPVTFPSTNVNIPGFESIQNGLVLITRSARCDFKKDFHLFDKVLVCMQIRNLRGASADLEFKFYNETTMELHAEGSNEIVFTNQNHKVCRIPENFKAAGLEYSVD